MDQTPAKPRWKNPVYWVGVAFMLLALTLQGASIGATLEARGPQVWLQIAGFAALALSMGVWVGLAWRGDGR